MLIYLCPTPRTAKVPSGRDIHTMVSAVTTEDTSEERAISILDEIFAGSSPERVGFRLWSGVNWPDERPHAATIVLRSPSSLAKMFLPGTEVGLAEAYLHNDFDIEGDIEAAFDIADSLLTRRQDLKSKVKLAGALLAQSGTHGTSKTSHRRCDDSSECAAFSERDRHVTRFHYNLSNDFFPTLARSTNDLFVRLLRITGRLDRSCAGAQTGLPLPQTAFTARSANARYRLWLGRAGHSRRETFRRSRRRN